MRLHDPFRMENTMVPNKRFIELREDIEPSATTKSKASRAHTMVRCSDLRTSDVVLENIAVFGSDYLRTKRPLGSHYLRMSAH